MRLNSLGGDEGCGARTGDRTCIAEAWSFGGSTARHEPARPVAEVGAWATSGAPGAPGRWGPSAQPAGVPARRGFRGIALFSCLLLAALVLAAHSTSARRTGSTVGGPGAHLVEVRFASHAALRRALREHPAHLVRVLGALHVAELGPNGDVRAFESAMRRAPGISSVREVVRRRAATVNSGYVPRGGSNAAVGAARVAVLRDRRRSSARRGGIGRPQHHHRCGRYGCRFECARPRRTGRRCVRRADGGTYGRRPKRARYLCCVACGWVGSRRAGSRRIQRRRSAAYRQGRRRIVFYRHRRGGRDPLRGRPRCAHHQSECCRPDPVAGRRGGDRLRRQTRSASRRGCRQRCLEWRSPRVSGGVSPACRLCGSRRARPRRRRFGSPRQSSSVLGVRLVSVRRRPRRIGRRRCRPGVVDG